MNRLIKEKLIGTTIAIISAMKMKLFATVFLSIIFSYNTLAQEQNNSNKKIIGEITVSGNTTFSPITIITYSGLSEGDEVSIPGEKISSAIKKLWESDLFSSVEVYKIKEVDNVVDLEIRLIDLPELSELEITGVKKRKYEDIIKEIPEKEIQTLFENGNHSKLIENLFEKTLPKINTISGDINEKLGILSESMSHYILTEMLIPSQRKIVYKDIEFDIIVPELSVLKNRSEDAIIIYFANYIDNSISYT